MHPLNGTQTKTVGWKLSSELCMISTQMTSVTDDIADWNLWQREAPYIQRCLLQQ